jgi:heptosyltransferase-1
VDEIIAIDGRGWRGALECRRELRARRFDLAVDLQGLMKSAIPAALARPGRLIGFAEPRERAAAMFYGERVHAAAAHIVEQNLELARAAGARNGPIEFPLPCGRREGELPEGGFVLAAPLAGWVAKQWPLAWYGDLGALVERRLALPLVLNGPPGTEALLKAIPHTRKHVSSIAGLIDATRRATAVVGVDSGPLHVAAALSKPGVAIFGPTDPARNGPYGGSLHVLRSPRAVTSYKRRREVDPSMREIAPEQVCEALEERLRA